MIFTDKERDMLIWNFQNEWTESGKVIGPESETELVEYLRRYDNAKENKP